jgi:hypothetical protein
VVKRKLTQARQVLFALALFAIFALAFWLLDLAVRFLAP